MSSFEMPSIEHQVQEFYSERFDQRFANEFFDDWIRNTTDHSGEPFSMESVLHTVYEQISHGVGRRYASSLDRWIEGDEGWEGDAFFKVNEDRSGHWELKPEVSVDEENGHISIQIHCAYFCRYLGDREREIIDDQPEQEKDFHVVFQADHKQVEESLKWKRKILEDKEKKAECAKLFSKFAESHLDREITYDEALKELDGREDVLIWANVGDVFKIRDGGEEWEIFIYKKEDPRYKYVGGLADIIHHPKVEETNQ